MTDITDFHPQLIDAFSKIWSLDPSTLTSSGNYLVVDVFFEGLWDTDGTSNANDVYMIDAETNNGTELADGLSVSENAYVLIKAANITPVKETRGEDAITKVFNQIGGGTLLNALLALLDAAVRDTTEGDFTFECMFTEEFSPDEVFEEFVDSEQTSAKLEQTHDTFGLARIADEHLRSVLNHTLASLYVRTRFSNDGLDSDAQLFANILGDPSDAPKLLEWLGWARILGEISGETETGARTFLVRVD